MKTGSRWPVFLGNKPEVIFFTVSLWLPVSHLFALGLHFSPIQLLGLCLTSIDFSAFLSSE